MWPFSRKSLDINTLPPISSESFSWGVAQAGYDDSPLLIRFNETAKDWQGHPELPIKLGFAIPLNSPNEGGLPDPEENEQLNEIEDLITGEVGSRATGIHALVLTTGEMKEFVFYISPGADIKTMHETLMQVVSTHEVQCMAVNEPKWDTYQQFSPG